MSESKCKECGKALNEEDYVFMGYCEDCYNKNESNNENIKNTKLTNNQKANIFTIIVVIIIAIIVFASNSGSNNKSKWDSLTKEEKQWYKDNYGDGQYDKYKKAIDNYKK